MPSPIESLQKLKGKQSELKPLPHSNSSTLPALPKALQQSDQDAGCAVAAKGYLQFRDIQSLEVNDLALFWSHELQCRSSLSQHAKAFVYKGCIPGLGDFSRSFEVSKASMQKVALDSQSLCCVTL